MPYFAAIYGFELTRPIDLPGVRLHPRVSQFQEAHSLATDRNRFNLTAVAELDEGDPEFLYDLSGAMTFCQQQWVPTTQAFEKPPGASPEAVFAEVPDPLPLPHRRPTQGAVIISDCFAPAARQGFLSLCLNRLQDADFDNGTSFRAAFFRSVEAWKLLRPLIDVTYYLYFSALEILARRFTNNFAPAVAPPIAQLLQHHGFDLVQDDSSNRYRAVQTYAHLRNALFHNGEFEKTINENGQDVTLRLTEYDDYLCRLLPDVLLKVLGYDDQHINWNRWRDRQPFQ